MSLVDICFICILIDLVIRNVHRTCFIAISQENAYKLVLETTVANKCTYKSLLDKIT